MITSTQIRNSEIFTFITLKSSSSFKVTEPEIFIYKQKRQ